jgi:hypothetical protein
LLALFKNKTHYVVMCPFGRTVFVFYDRLDFQHKWT